MNGEIRSLYLSVFRTFSRSDSTGRRACALRMECAGSPNLVARLGKALFSSKTYKDLPSVGTIKVHHPITGKEWEYHMPGGGRGYTRPASLVSLSRHWRF